MKYYNFDTFQKNVKWDNNRLTIYKRSGVCSTSLNTTKIKKVMGKKFLLGCPCCKKEVEFRYMELDHIIARKDGGTSENENTCYLCAECHNKKSLLELKGKCGTSYKKIQRLELASKEKYKDLYAFFELLSRCSNKTLELHPRYSMRSILLKLVEVFKVAYDFLIKLLNSFSNLYTMRKNELNNFLNEVRYYYPSGVVV